MEGGTEHVMLCCLSELHRHLLMSESHWVTSPAQQQPTAGVIAKVGPLQYPQ